MLALIAAFERQDIHGSFRFRDEADHHADWAASAMLPGDVEEAKRYDLVSELAKLGWMESRESGESSSQDHVAESAELSGESSSPKRLAVSALCVVEQASRLDEEDAEFWKQLEFHIVDGYLIISDYPSRVGILGARFDSAVVARKFWQTSVAGTLVECPCGGRMKIFNVLDAHFRHMNPGTGVVGTDNKVKKMMEKHGYCFHAIAVITQLKFEAGEELFKSEYDVNYWN